MADKSSPFIKETRDREAWLAGAAERHGSGGREEEQLLAVAALTRGVLQALPVPDDAEERSREKAVAFLKELHFERLAARTQARAPWYLRFGRLMRYVFTLGRRR
jgi:hypothetical protein